MSDKSQSIAVILSGTGSDGTLGLEAVKDLGSKIVLDALTCVECGRCQVNCPAWGAGKELNPKTIILQTQEAVLAGHRERKLGEVYSEQVLWQCTTCGACENQCPVGIEHLPILIGSRRGLVSNGDAPGSWWPPLAIVRTSIPRHSRPWPPPTSRRTSVAATAGTAEHLHGVVHQWQRTGACSLRAPLEAEVPAPAAAGS